MELGFSQVSAPGVIPTYGIGRPAAIGINPTIMQNFIDEGDGNAPTSLTTAAVAWGIAPTVPTNFNRRVSTAIATGAGIILTFPRGFGIPVSSSVVIWIIAATTACDVYSVVDE
jgi:hypothetical protein